MPSRITVWKAIVYYNVCDICRKSSRDLSVRLADGFDVVLVHGRLGLSRVASQEQCRKSRLLGFDGKPLRRVAAGRHTDFVSAVR
jgi:hypothetical protein